MTVMQDGKNNKLVSARYWWLLLPLIAMYYVKADERQQARRYFVKRQDVEGDQNKFQQEFNISSRNLDGYPRCSTTFYERNFFFSSANYPQNYESNADCIFTVKRSDNVCNLQLIFQNFDLEESDRCLYDYLEIYGQKFCGSLSPNTQRVYPFTGSEIVIRFRTNAVISNRGFFIRGAQLTCGQESAHHDGGPSEAHNCDQTFHQREFNMTSPNYPAAYASDLYCTYVIKKSGPDICLLQITFVSLDLEGSVGECRNDFLEMDHEKMCYLPRGSTRTVEFMGAAYCIRFRSGNGRRSAYARFSLSIRQLPCSSVSPSALPVPPYQPPPPVHGRFCSLGFDPLGGRDPSTTTDDLRFHIRSPGFPLPYPPDQDCLFVVRKASVHICTLQMVVDVFDVDPSLGCRRDFLSIGNQKFCGTLQKGSKRQFDFPGDEIHIRFQSSDSRFRSGFFLTFWQQGCFFPGIQTTSMPWSATFQPARNCDFSYNFRNFEIISPAQSRFGPLNSMCTYTVERLQNPNSCALVLEFLEFDFGTVIPAGSKGNSCEEAFLEISGERLCQSGLRGTTRKYTFDKSTFQVRFFSGSIHPSRFRIRGTQLPCTVAPQDPYPYPVHPSYPYPSPHFSPSSPCNCTYQQEEFLITSASFPPSPSWPPKASFCVFIVCKARLDICSLDVVFERFDLQKTSGCAGEYLEVDNQRYCDTIPTGTVRRHEFREDHLRVNLYSCGGVVLLRFRQIPCTAPYPITPSPPLVECDVIQSEPEFRWMSSNYPNPYDSNSDCRLTIQKYDTIVCELLVTFNHFDLEQSADCQQDYVEIMGHRFCGHMVGGTQKAVPFDANSLMVRFHSGQNFNNRSGFDAVFKQQFCFDGQIFRRSGIDVGKKLNLTINGEGHSQSPMILDASAEALAADEMTATFIYSTSKNFNGSKDDER